MVTKIKNSLKKQLLSLGLYETVKKITISTGIYAPSMNMLNAEIKRNVRRKKENPVVAYKKRFNPQIFIETGTFQGDMIDAMKNRFKKLYSIELSDSLYEKARIKFVNEKNIELLHGDSGKILPEILESINEPVLFWLDAHYSGGVTARGELDTPIERELKSIFSHKIKNHAILIDDANDFNGKNDYPKKESLKKTILENGYYFEEMGNVFGIYPLAPAANRGVGRKFIKKVLYALGIDAFVWNRIESIKNKVRYQRILKKNIKSILEYKNKFDYTIFIETGTHKGNMIAAMKNRFEKIYSIELGGDLYRMARKRFANDPHIQLFRGDSGIVLPELLKSIRQPAIFWLDAHYSGGETAQGEVDTAIRRELDAILQHPIKNHVIMIDDARCFDGKNGYPTPEKIEEMALSHNYLFEMKDDNFRLYPKTK